MIIQNEINSESKLFEIELQLSFPTDLYFLPSLVTPGNPQRCNSMIAKRSIQLNFSVGLFTLGVLALVNTISENCQK